jgi:hypothetical protein
MKKSLTITLALLITSGAGWWLGRHSIAPHVDRSFRRGHSSVSISSGGGNFPKEAFTMVNFELPQKIDELVNEVARLDHFVVVIPKALGYRVEVFAPSNSSIWEDKNYEALTEWISQRMNDVPTETHQKAEQVGAGQPATRSQSSSEGSDKPQPESEGRSR